MLSLTIFLVSGKLTLKIPWKNLYTESVVASIDGLYALAVPNVGEFCTMHIFSTEKNTLNLSLFKHVSQELLMVFWKKKVKRMNGGVYTIEIMENFEQLDFKHMAKRIMSCPTFSKYSCQELQIHCLLISHDVLFANNKIRACIATFKSSIPHYIGVFV